MAGVRIKIGAYRDGARRRRRLSPTKEAPEIARPIADGSGTLVLPKSAESTAADTGALSALRSLRKSATSVLPSRLRSPFFHDVIEPVPVPLSYPQPAMNAATSSAIAEPAPFPETIPSRFTSPEIE